MTAGGAGDSQGNPLTTTCEARDGAPIPKWGLSVGCLRFAGESPTFFYAEKNKATEERARGLGTLWAALCAEHVLPYFEKECPSDDRPRKAIEEARRWVREGKPMKMAVIRKASLDAHAAARATENPAARAAARAAGQAVATVHVATHAPGAAYYALKVAKAVGGETKVATERKWQQKQLPKRLRMPFQKT